MQAPTRRTFRILAILVCIACPLPAAAVGEYDGVWGGPETVHVEGEPDETFNGMMIIYQPDEAQLYFAEDSLGSIRLVRSGNTWSLPAPISTTFFGYDVVVNSMQMSFPALTQLSSTVNLSVNAGGGTWVNGSADFAFTKQSCPTLTSGIPVQNLSGSEDSYSCFQIDVQQGAVKLSAQTSGGTGDCDLGIFYSKPDFTSETSEGDYNDEAVSLSSPQPGRWYVFLYGWLSYSGLTLTATYEVGPVVQAAFSATPTTGWAPLSVKFSDQSTGGVSSWSWNFGDGSSSTEQNPTHIYRAKGSYSVSLTASGPASSDTETKTALILVKPARAMSWLPLLLDD